MSVLSISFYPDIGRAPEPASAVWIEGVDWNGLYHRSMVLPEIDVTFSIDGNSFGYYPDNAAGVLSELATSLQALRDGDYVTFAVQTYTVLCAQRVQDGWQFYDPFASYENGVLKPLERQKLIGAPIAQATVDTILREAMATIGRYIELGRA